MKIIRKIFSIGSRISEAREIKKDPEKRLKSKKFGLMSIVSSILSIGFVALLFFALSQIFGGENLGQIILGIVLAVIGALTAVSSLLNSVGFCILQISINRKAISWIALIFLFIGIAACALVALKILALI